jgi:hypothetical protein
MRHTIRALVFLALALSARPGVAEESRVSYLLNSGVSVPIGPEVFRRAWNPGPTLEAGVEYALSELVSLWGKGDHAWHALDEAQAGRVFYTQGPMVGVSGGGLRIWGLAFGARLRATSGAFRPYFDVGAGVRTISGDEAEVRYEYFLTGEVVSYRQRFASETKPAFGAGVGVLYAARPSLGIFADVRVEALLTEGETTQWIPVRFGVRFR